MKKFAYRSSEVDADISAPADKSADFLRHIPSSSQHRNL